MNLAFNNILFSNRLHGSGIVWSAIECRKFIKGKIH